MSVSLKCLWHLLKAKGIIALIPGVIIPSPSCLLYIFSEKCQGIFVPFSSPPEFLGLEVMAEIEIDVVVSNPLFRVLFQFS